MPAILALLGSIVGKVFADKVISCIALKAMLVFLFVVIVPIILNNFLYDIIKIFMDLAASQSSSAGELNGNMNFTGFAAWILERFRVAEAFALFVSAICLRLVLNMIPFVRLVG